MEELHREELHHCEHGRAAWRLSPAEEFPIFPPSPTTRTDIRPFVIQVESTTLSIPLEEAEARQLAVGLNNVLKTFQEKQTAERPKRWDSMSVTLEGNRVWVDHI